MWELSQIIEIGPTTEESPSHGYARLTFDTAPTPHPHPATAGIQEVLNNGFLPFSPSPCFSLLFSKRATGSGIIWYFFLGFAPGSAFAGIILSLHSKTKATSLNEKHCVDVESTCFLHKDSRALCS